MDYIEKKGVDFPAEVCFYGVEYLRDTILNGVTLFIKKSLVRV